MKTGVVGTTVVYHGLFYSERDIDMFMVTVSKMFHNVVSFYKSDPNIEVQLEIGYIGVEIDTIPHIYTGYEDDTVENKVRLSSYGSIIVKDPSELEKVIKDTFKAVKNLMVTVEIQTFEKDY